jgi:hypothetical protein
MKLSICFKSMSPGMLREHYALAVREMAIQSSRHLLACRSSSSSDSEPTFSSSTSSSSPQHACFNASFSISDPCLLPSDQLPLLRRRDVWPSWGSMAVCLSSDQESARQQFEWPLGGPTQTCAILAQDPCPSSDAEDWRERPNPSPTEPGVH